MIYFISGLGADERVFQFLDLANLDHKFIKWVHPDKSDTLKTYCGKLVAQIDLTQEVKLIGISFGGIIAQELAKIIPCKKVVIISSVKTTSELGWQIWLVRKLQMHKLAPIWFLIWSNKISADYFFGTETKPQSQLLHQIIRDTDAKFLKWAIDQIVNWNNTSYPDNLVHIHGTNDRIFPIKNIKNAIEIPTGGHFMIVINVALVQARIFEHIQN